MAALSYFSSRELSKLADAGNIIYSYVVKTTYSITSAQAKLPTLVRECAKGLITITKRDEAVAYVVSRERMETLLETMEILANPKAMKALKDAREGKTKYYPLESFDED